jgi:hypothetical protein
LSPWKNAGTCQQEVQLSHKREYKPLPFTVTGGVFELLILAGASLFSRSLNTRAGRMEAERAINALKHLMVNSFRERGE